MQNEAWSNLKENLQIGSMAEVTVASHQIYGVHVTLDDGTWGVLERIKMEKDGYSTPAAYPAIGIRVKCIVLGFRDWSQQVEFALLREPD